MPNIRLIIEYDGSGFHGWQAQPGLRTIQGELQRVLEIALREKPQRLAAASRTDAGVHARGQVVNFVVEGEPDLKRLAHSVSSLLKNEVAVVGAELVPDDFHATVNARRKQYTYTVVQRATPLVLDRGRAWHVAAPLNIERMQQAARELLGVHDFSSFRGSHCTARTPIKEIFESEVAAEGQYLRYRVVGSAFLKQMVRNIAGTLVAIGKGQLAPMSEILAALDRAKAGPTAPPWGLCLDWVQYQVSDDGGL